MKWINDKTTRSAKISKADIYRLIALFSFLIFITELLSDFHRYPSFEIIKALLIIAAFSISINHIYNKLEKQRSSREEVYAKLFKKNPHPMWIYDLTTLKFLHINDAAVSFYGHSENEFLNMTIKDIRPEEDVPALIEKTEETKLNFNLGYHWSGIWRHKTKSNQLMYVEISSHEIIFEGKKAELVLAYDATERVNQDLKLQSLNQDLERHVMKRTNDLLQLNRKLVDQNKIIKSANLELYTLTTRLKEANEKIQEQTEMKSKFISMASHEFRTPLAVIKMNANFIKRYIDRSTKEEITGKIDSIEMQITHMTCLLDDVLTIGKTDSSKIEVTTRELNIRGLVEEIVYDVQRTVNSGSHKILIKIDENVPQTVYSDEKLLRNIFLNLLTNAIKYSPGRDHAYFNIVYSDGRICFSIKDEGLGINSAELPKIFEPFYRTELTSAIQGTGLGLTIVKRAVDLIGAKINVESEIDKGTVFKVLLPTIILS